MQAITSALAEAAGVPLEIAQIGAEVAELAAELAEHGNTNLRGDAAAGAVLAEASVRAAATLVAINLSARPDDGRISRSAALASAAAGGCRESRELRGVAGRPVADRPPVRRTGLRASNKDLQRGHSFRIGC